MSRAFGKTAARTGTILAQSGTLCEDEMALAPVTHGAFVRRTRQRFERIKW
jgi:hypothetical protein